MGVMWGSVYRLLSLLPQVNNGATIEMAGGGSWASEQDEGTQMKMKMGQRKGYSYPETHTNEGGIGPQLPAFQ